MAKPGPKTDWDKEQLDAAVHAYLNGSNSSYRKVAKKYGIPKSTLADYVKKRKQQLKSKTQSKTSRTSPKKSQTSSRQSRTSRTSPKKSQTSSRQSRMSRIPSEQQSETRPGQQEKQENVLDPGKSLLQMHADKALQLEGKIPWWFGCGVLAGMLIQELWVRKTGKPIFGSLFRSQSDQQEVSGSQQETIDVTEDSQQAYSERSNPNLPKNSQYAGKDLNIG